MIRTSLILFFAIFFTALDVAVCGFSSFLTQSKDFLFKNTLTTISFRTPTHRKYLANSEAGSRLFLQDYINIIRENNFFGSWFATNTTSPTLDYFSYIRGVTMMETLNSQISTDAAKRNPTYPPTGMMALAYSGDVWDIVIKLYDGEYVDQKSADIYSYLRPDDVIGLNADNATITLPAVGTQIYLRDSNADYIRNERCNTNLTIFFININTNSPYLKATDSIRDLGVQFEINSPECNLYAISSILYFEPYFEQKEIFLLFGVLILHAGLHMFAAWRLRLAMNKRRIMRQISLGSLWLIASCDYYLLIVNLVIIFAFSYIFVITLLLYVLLTFYAERELILQLVQGRTGQMQPSEMSDEDCRTCGLSFAISAVMFIMELVFILLAKIWIIQLTALIFVPQIIHNIIKGRAYRPNGWHICLLGVSNILFIMYLKLYPNNLFRLYPDPSFIEIYAGILLAQLLILLVQMRYPRFVFGLKAKNARSEPVPGEDVCPICFESLKENYVTESMSSVTHHGSLAVPLTKHKALIETPCGHIFHNSCLSEWSKSKPACPMCRHDIREIIEEFESSSDNV